ncbi:MAG TPA: Xaa-Pro peptidase family protein [Methylomusa anaerophila]|uniref:Xaa-Pro dipeptidase n=1 Tax=Methylomusa anaerophila TaxID=1930071 RepID=A0A348AGF9_9FIRM|nr:Xaa-Pro peptidase family protein [Methylomusa anaerophila]BBB90157.1 Xaa-Pro dipeptidase [Methylomusa anaerophila]HML88117.1 Xaa-Pro peptidase family protein [Methylomusa anaerophila]
MADFEMQEYETRVGRLRQVLAANSVDLLVLNQNTDLYYYTGSVQPLYAVIPAKGKQFVLARKALQRIREEVVGFHLEEFRGTNDLAQIIQRNGLPHAKRIGFALDNTAYSTVERWQDLFPAATICDLSWQIRQLRMVKSKAEIAIFAKAGAILNKLPQIVRESFRPSMTELELSAAIEYYFRLNGHCGLTRCRREGIEMGLGVCSSGVNSLAGTKFDGICGGVGVSAAVPYGAACRAIVKNQPIILDYGFNIEGYHVDQTRMFSWGEPAEPVLKAYQAMLKVEEAVFAVLKPGCSWTAVYETALQAAAAAGYETEFMGLGPEKVRFVGHGVGLELDEPPFLAPKMNFPLETGMVVAVEPKVSLPGIGVIGIEDTVVIRENGNGIETITTCPRDFFLIN